MSTNKIVIAPDESVTLCGLFKERVKRSGSSEAYRYFDKEKNRWLSHTWLEAASQVARLQVALTNDGMKPGDKVAIMLRNSPEWVFFEQAALGLGLVVVPLYTNDRADNISYVLQDAGVKILLIEGHEQLAALSEIASQMDGLIRLLSLRPCAEYNKFNRLMTLSEWTKNIPKDVDHSQLQTYAGNTRDLATIVYTSGTTGRPKGVMLCHENILNNAYTSGWIAIQTYPTDLFLSFLPLSHMLERMAGYYIPMTTGGTVAYARSVPDLPEDLLTVRPTVLISVPRIYERIANKISLQLEQKSNFARNLFLKAVDTGWERFQNPGAFSLSWPLLKLLIANKVMAKLGGRLRLAICGGAPLSPSVAKTFIGLGLNLVQGYGLTETSPVIAVNKIEDNDPASVGLPLRDVEVKIADTGELLTKGPHVMLGYWNNQTATDDTIDSDGWLHTGDKAKIENEKVYITGRIKEIIVLSNGEKVPPSDMELAICMDPLFEQVMVVGEQKPYLTAVIVLNEEQWGRLCRGNQLDSQDQNTLHSDQVMQIILGRVKAKIAAFPGYAQINRIALSTRAWSVENGLITPTLKLKRNKIMEFHESDINALYEGH
ncbi:MAG: long-chain fatty acid--CoA ligase [Gammaproteobacteria bacterium]|nr:long-chain fatty acid--CoA ligase [Gammaproteobacteria bacterium]MDH5803332.1 long-chain fatty acid--CoA ligase [Gammaproteobacteria bacterium]